MPGSSKRIWWYALGLLVMGALSGVAWQQSRQATLSEAVVLYPAPRQLNGIDLTDADGQPLTEQDFKEHWSLVFVGYTYCPDICPTTLADMAAVYGQLKQASAQTRLVFVSADPKRDTQERLKAYTAYFNPEFIAATAEHDKLMPAVQQLGLIYGIYDRDGSDYLVDHSASIALINPDGQLHASFRPSFTDQSQVPLVNSDLLVQDFTRIVNRWR
ncbi:SCO family protein [Zobellella maritima]|uniref:SCO family protein n=1 Tax=Zobellella maritima TaxID=2059725 RepID=UPI000E3070E1|nr:SCO family protein [Zobellella maritima]